MKINRTFLFLLVVSCFIFPAGAQDAPAELDAMIREGMADWEVPGLITAVVKDGEVQFAQAYGVRNRESGAPVNGQTLFTMASTTKAVVCMGLGILVDRGQLAWDDPVSKHLPAFDLSDPYIRGEARVQDLLTHNLGIASADLLWVLDSVSAGKTLERFALAEKAYPIRGGFQYNNLMYAAAGAVIESVSGKPWTQFIDEEILGPLEMTRTQTRSASLPGVGNFVTPYEKLPGGDLVTAPYWFSDQIGSAGMMWTCLDDIQNYLIMLTQDGEYKGKRLLSPETFDYLFKPHAFVTESEFYPTQELTQPHWRTYGLGWFQHDYAGEKLDFHTGSLPGLSAIAGIMRDRKTAVYVLANLDHAELRHAILYKAMDLWALDAGGRNWHDEVFALYSGLREKGEKAEADLVAGRIAGTSPSLPLSAYAGTYHHPMVGTARVRVSDGSLLLEFNEFAEFRLEHWHYDTFRSDLKNRTLTRLMVPFKLGADGKPESLEALGNTFKKSPE
ncbi:serine hydrolase [Robiginitalea sp. SC105]|uniref:serine hydrolase n=1 Tax=Robiginitalea sp. SC105 TaxID=2762332 RepID=UPI001639BA3D|nr:serine hydrolase [Robiginitalea sp. SC105]MBC2838474.1 serine hydrolase [Robiginitalea sp. SC105]